MSPSISVDPPVQSRNGNFGPGEPSLAVEGGGEGEGEV